MLHKRGELAVPLTLSQAPSAVTEPICSCAGIWFRSSGNIGASPIWCPLFSTARTSRVCASILGRTLRQMRRLEPPRFRRFHRPPRPRYGMFTSSVFCQRHKVLTSGTVQSDPVSFSGLCTRPVVWRGGIRTAPPVLASYAWPNRPCRPRLPCDGGAQIIAKSNQLVSDPHPFNASLQAHQFAVLYFARVQPLIASSYHTGFTQ